jgi:hypothetical protein
LLAQVEAQQKQEPPPAPTTITLNANDSTRPSSDLDSEGEVAITHLKLSVDITHLASQRDILTFSGGVDLLRYDFSDDAGFFPGATDLFDDVHVLRLEGSYMRVFNQRWMGLGYGAIFHSFEQGASLQDSVTFAIGVGILCRIDEKLTVGLTLRPQTRIEDSPYLYPVPYIDWKISPRLDLRTEQKAGYGFGLAYALDQAKEVALDTRAYYAARRFRLDSRSIPDEGVIEDERVAWDVGFRFQPSPRFSAGLHAGIDLWQRFSVENKQGNNLEKIHTDPVPFLAFSLSYGF